MYKLCFYVPENATDLVKKAIFDAGAGKIGNYDSCCWQTLGTGQFRPLEHSRPYLGEHGRIETVAEFKVEMVCADEHIKAAIAALKKAHPYEEPAFEVYRLEDL
jgi:hypothetical protein